MKIERTETDDDLVEYVRYDYEGENMTDKTRVTRTAKEDWRYEYDEEGGLIRETLVRNGNIVKEIVHTEEGKYYEVIYRDGAPSLRVYFEDGEKVDEEFLGGGEAVQ